MVRATVTDVGDKSQPVEERNAQSEPAKHGAIHTVNPAKNTALPAVLTAFTGGVFHASPCSSSHYDGA